MYLLVWHTGTDKQSQVAISIDGIYRFFVSQDGFSFCSNGTIYEKNLDEANPAVAFSDFFVGVLFLGPVVNVFVDILNLIDYTESESSGGGYTLLAFYCIMLFAIRYVGNRQPELKDNPVIDVFLNMLLLAVLIQMLALKLSILTRCTEFFRFSLVILIPNVLMSFRKKERMLLITACVTLYALFCGCQQK